MAKVIFPVGAPPADAGAGGRPKCRGIYTPHRRCSLRRCLHTGLGCATCCHGIPIDKQKTRPSRGSGHHPAHLPTPLPRLAVPPAAIVNHRCLCSRLPSVTGDVPGHACLSPVDLPSLEGASWAAPQGQSTCSRDVTGHPAQCLHFLLLGNAASCPSPAGSCWERLCRGAQARPRGWGIT